MNRNWLELNPEEISTIVDKRQGLQRREIDDYLRSEVVGGYEHRREKFWDRDYSSIPAYHQSVESNRRRWEQVLGEFSSDIEDPEVKTSPFFEDETLTAEFISVKLFEEYELRGRAVLARPKNHDPPHPLIICQHGYGSSPERVFGFNDDENLYHSFGRKLPAEGMAVLAPLNITDGDPRNRFERLSRLIDKSLFGLEVYKTRRLLDYASAQTHIDEDNIGMWGISLGGLHTLFTLPIEKRIDVGICTAYFNHRPRKMAVRDRRFTEYISVPQYEHMFLRGWVREFADPDLISLICPRPFQIQSGEMDSIAWIPDIEEQFTEAKTHYEKLGRGDNIDLNVHNGGHEINWTAGIDFLSKHLG